MARAAHVLLVAIAAAGTPSHGDGATAGTSTPPDAPVIGSATAEADARADGSTAQALVEPFALALGDLSRTLVRWIGEHGDHDVEALLRDPPRIVFVPEGGTVDLGHGPVRLGADVRGAYERTSGVLLLTVPWYLADPLDRSILLHELVHAVQFGAREWRCAAETEWEAHVLQHRWLAEQGVDITVDWLRVGILSRCPDGEPRR